MDERLRKANIDKESKVIIHGHVHNLDATLNKTLDERARQLDEKVNGGLAQATKKK